MNRNRLLKAAVISIPFIPLWLTYTALIYMSNKTNPEYDVTFLDSLEYSFVIIGVATVLGILGFIRIEKQAKSNSINFLKIGLLELFFLFLFLFLWLVTTELILLNFIYDSETQAIGLWEIISNIITKTGKLYSGVYLYASFTALTYAYIYYKRNQESYKSALEAKALANEMRMKAMMNYMQPHFFFNCLSSISELIHIDPHEADDALNKLSGILRYLIDTKEQFHQLSSELELTNKYVELQKIRFTDKFNYKEEVEKDISDILIPILSIQLLVENSFQHATRNTLNNKSAIEIFVKIYKKNNVLNIIVCDNGFNPSYSPKKGSGLSMLESRMKAAFKDIDFNHGYKELTIMNQPGYQSHIMAKL